MVNRKLIRPSLADIKEQIPRGPVSPAAPMAMPSASASSVSAARKRIPPEQTNAENYYYIKQMAAKTPMVIKLVDGEEIRGVIEWYDKSCIKVHRHREPNILIFKHNIRYMFKEDELTQDRDDPEGFDMDGQGP